MATGQSRRLSPPPDSLTVLADSALLDLTDRIAALALTHRLPTFATTSEVPSSAMDPVAEIAAARE